VPTSTTATATGAPSESASAPSSPSTATCNLTAVEALPVYNRASVAGGLFGTLEAGASVEATVRTADGFYGFDPGVAQAGNAGLFRLRWVLKTTGLTTTTGCAALPVVTPPISGVCYAMIMGDVPVRSGPDVAADTIITMRLGDYAMVTAVNAGWYALDLNVGTAGIDSLGYLQEADLGGLNGPCD